jgi:CheY-like chemotaxis protein
VKERRILIVDDSLTIRKLAERVLSREGYRIELAETMVEALHKVPLFRPDLVLLDYILPDGHGTDICRTLLKNPETAAIPILMISAKGADIRKLYMDLSNVVDFLTKPFTPVVLTSVVEHVLEHGLQPAVGVSRRPNVAGGRVEFLPSLATLVSRSLNDDQWKEIPPSIRHAMDSMKVEAQDPSTTLLLSGSTRLVPLEDVLAACEREGVTGKLNVADREGLTLTTWLEDGRVAYTIPHRTFFEAKRVISHLTDVPAQTLRDAEERQKAGEKSGVTLLTEEGFLDTDTARRLAREIAITALLETMEDPDLRFRVETTRDRPEEGRSFGFDLDIDELRMERLRRTDAWHTIEGAIPSLDVMLVRSSGASRLSARLSLTPLESKILDLVDGNRTVRDIVQAMNSTAFEVCQVLYRLAGAEVVRLKQRRGEADGHQIRRVLVVDSDEEGLCPTITEILTELQAGVEIRCQSDTFNRIPYIIKIFQPDTILIDVHLDGFDTTKLVKLLRHSGEFQTIRIIGMGTDLGDAEIRQLYRVGFNGFLPKPFLTEQLTEFFTQSNANDTPHFRNGDRGGTNLEGG